MEGVSNMSVQNFLALREAAAQRQNVAARPVPSTAQGADWRTLLETKRKEIGLQPTRDAAPSRAAAQTFSPSNATTLRAAVHTQPTGTVREQAEALRAQLESGRGVVRKYGNFVDIKA